MEHEEFNSNVNGRKIILFPTNQSMLFQNKEDETLPSKMLDTTDEDLKSCWNAQNKERF